jgi:hypothetical protein
MYKPVSFRSYTHQKYLTIFLVFQFANCKPWYYIFNKKNPLNNDVDCPEIIFSAPPEEKTGPFTSHYYLKR